VDALFAGGVKSTSDYEFELQKSKKSNLQEWSTNPTKH